MLSFKYLYETYVSDIYRFSLWLTGDRSEAEDITSETFIRAWIRFSTIRTETLKAYLFTIARNIYLDHVRKSKRKVALKDTYPDPNPGPEELTETYLELKRIQKFLYTLPEVDRSVFILRVQQDLPYEEVARILSLTLTTAKVKVHRVRKKLLAFCFNEEVY
jgi:RNA polymerase sigma-70 factor (ECF subfamily)